MVMYMKLLPSKAIKAILQLMAYFAWVTTTKDISNCIVTTNEEITD